MLKKYEILSMQQASRCSHHCFKA